MAGFFVYILECQDGSMYTGWTTDVRKRVDRHNIGRGAKYTRSRRPVKLVYTEVLSSRIEAMRREHHIKKLSRTQKRQLVLQSVKFGELPKQ